MRMPKLIRIVFFEDSRKVGFGVILFGISTWLLMQKLIDANNWMICMALSATLIGGGTVADNWLKVKGGANAEPTKS